LFTSISAYSQRALVTHSCHWGFHHEASPEQRSTVEDILKHLTVHEAAEVLQVPEADIVELQPFRGAHVRIRFREPCAARAAYENLKADTGIFVGSDLSVSSRQTMHQAVQALSAAGYQAKMAGNMVKYRAEGRSPRLAVCQPQEHGSY
jgi:hypothetical protein